MLRRLALALLFSLASTVASAQEFIAVPDMISDEDFYRLVACAAPPGGTCTKPLIRWPEARRQDLRIGIADVAPNFPGYKLDLVDRAIDTAIAEINATGAALRLRRVYEGTVDIPLYLVATPVVAEDAPVTPPAKDEGFSLMEEGMKLVLRGMMQEMQPALDEMGNLAIILDEQDAHFGLQGVCHFCGVDRSRRRGGGAGSVGSRVAGTRARPNSLHAAQRPCRGESK